MSGCNPCHCTPNCRSRRTITQIHPGRLRRASGWRLAEVGWMTAHKGSGITVLDDYARPHWNSISPFCALIPFPGCQDLPGLQRPGDGAHGQQDQAVGCRADARAAAQSTCPSTWDCLGRTPFPGTTGPLSQLVKLMADMSHRLRDAASEAWDPRYARMIPGTPGTPLVASAPTVRNRPNPDVRGTRAPSENPQPHHPRSRNWARFLIPRPQTADRFVLYQLAIPDLIVLLVVCLLPSRVFPGWSLPPLAMPIYAVLVVLFAFREGLYENLGAPPAEEFPVMARAALFAMALVLVAAWNDTQPLAALTALVTSMASLLLWRQLRRRGWNEHFREAEPRNVLIVGAGPAACAIARSLREDPLHQATVVGFLDDHLPLSPQVLG